MLRQCDDGPELWHGALSFPVDTTAAEALAAMRDSGQRCAFVVYLHEPIGVVTDDELASAPPSAAVSDVVRWTIVKIPFDTGEGDTLRRYDQAAWRWLLRPWDGASDSASTPG
jgi:hypothetical protein